MSKIFSKILFQVTLNSGNLPVRQDRLTEGLRVCIQTDKWGLHTDLECELRAAFMLRTLTFIDFLLPVPMRSISELCCPL